MCKLKKLMFSSNRKSASNEKNKVTNELLNQLLENYQKPEDLIGPRVTGRAGKAPDHACHGCRADETLRLRQE
jgi:hypothetical protein